MQTTFARLAISVMVGLMASIVLSPRANAVSEAELSVALAKQIMPYYETARKGTFVGKDGVTIAYRVYSSNSGSSGAVAPGTKAILLLNGRSEFMRKYAEFIYDLKLSGFAIYTMDLRGQGESGRMLSEPRKGYVKHFHDYVEDLGTFIDQVVRKDSPSEIHLVAHSLGGAIATIYAIEHPDVFQSMVLASPMFAPNLGIYSEKVALGIGWLFDRLGRGEALAPSQKLDSWHQPFEENRVTHSRARFSYAREFIAADPSIEVGGATIHWVMEAIRADKWIRANASQLSVPTRVMVAEQEQIVLPEAEVEVCKAAKAGDLQMIPLARHELFMETDSIRDHVIMLTLDWLNRHRTQ